MVEPLTDPSSIGRNSFLKQVMRNYVLIQGELFRKGSDGLLLWCIRADQVMKTMAESHYSSCGLRQIGEKMAWVIRRHGLFWPSIRKDRITMARGCQTCQMHSNIPRVHTVELHSIV